MTRTRRRRKGRRRRRSQRGGACGCPKVVDNSPLPVPKYLPPGPIYKPGGLNEMAGGYYYGVNVDQSLPDPVNQVNLGQMGGRRRRRKTRRRRRRRRSRRRSRHLRKRRRTRRRRR